MQNGWTERIEELEAEVGRLQMMNPCNHTGFESAPCDVCGYPDPRKLIAKLKEENQRLREALDLVISFIPDGWRMPLGFNQAARQAREAMREASHEG